MLSVPLGVCGMFGWGVYDYLGGVLSKRMGAFGPLLWSHCFGPLSGHHDAGRDPEARADLAASDNWGRLSSNGDHRHRPLKVSLR
jgi:hypothetical protein